ncbi:MAG TPA: class I SAM-dependent methyltransferase [Variovorax sp.]|nr:class I SAM-dependent methyltransferase [Variovorax sp.]
MANGSPQENGPLGSILRDVERYYTSKVRRHGPTPLGVDWNSPMSQRLRFVQLLKVVDWTAVPLSLHDLGCGYGALLEHLQDRHQDAGVQYLGSDLSVEMIKHAGRLWASHVDARFDLTATPLPVVDYTVASGIFNVCLGYSVTDWEDHVAATLAQMHASSCRGFSVNFMTQRTLFERPATAGQLYATEPDRWMTYCAKQLNCKICCVQDYGLNEFTLLATHAAS